MNFATPDAWDEYDAEAERMHGPSSHLCHVYQEDGTEILLTDDELEEFERDAHLEMDSDMPPAHIWRRLLRWLIKNIGLFDVTHNTLIKHQQRQPTAPDYEI